MLTPEELKSAAAEERRKIETRVKGRQGGVATYFDVFVCNFLDRLTASESEHGWNPHPRDPRARRWNPFRARGRVRNTRDAAELQWFVSYLRDREHGRLVEYELRHGKGRGRSDIRSPERMLSQGNAECLSWKGMPLFKTIYDFAILPMLMWELKPASVFEIGSGTGASACWMADVLDAFGLDTRVYSVDLKPVGQSHPRVRFLAGDCTTPESLFGADLLRAAPHPYLIVEDAHKNVREVLRYLDGFLIEGDYVFVEDSLDKHEALRAFLSDCPNRYLVDTHYTDFFGRNATSAIDSILVRA
jgi:cephalosporin hydroxylase